MSTTYEGFISLLQNEKGAVFPITSADGVLLEPTDTTTKLSEKLVEIDKDIEQITKVTNTIQKDGDGSIAYTEAGLAHTNTTMIPQGLNPTVNEAIYKFKIDKNGHITDIKEAGLEDFGIGMPIKYYGEYPTNNSSFIPSAGEMYLVNAEFIKEYHKGDINDFAIYDGINFNIIQSDINPNIQLNNGTVHIYGTGGVTNIYAPTELGENGKILGTDGKNLTWMDYPNLKLPSLYAGKNNDGTFITYNLSNVYLQGDDYISVNGIDSSKIKFSLNSDKLKTSGISFNVSDNNATLSSGGQSVTLTGDNVSFSNDNGNLKLTASKPGAGIGLTYEGNTLKANLKFTQGITSISKDNQVTVTTQLGTSDGGKDAAIFGSTAFTITGDDNIKIGNGESAITLSTDGLAKSKELNSLSTSLNTDLTNEIRARKAVDGQSGQAYVKNTHATHIKNATSLNNADVLLSSALDAEIANRTSADANLSNKIASLQGHVDSMSASYPYITEEIWGKNHNYAWEQASRIDKLGNAFNWGLRFSDGIILAPHNNGIIVPYGTTEKIYLPKCGVCWVGYTLFSKAPITITVGGISVSLNGEQYVVNKDDENNKFYMRRVAGLKTILSEPYLTIQSSQGTTSGIDKTAYLTDIVIYFEDGSPTKQMQLQESINTINESYRYVNSWDQDNNNSNIFSERFENLSQGFYQLTYSVQGTSVTPSITTDGEKYCVIASLLYPINTMTEGVFNIRNNGSYFTNRNFYTKDCKVHHDIITTNSNNINNFNYTTFQTIYYLPESGTTTLYLRTWNKGIFTVKNVSLKPIQWSDTINNSIINSSTINNPFLNLISQNSNLYNHIIEDDDGKQYIQLVYEVDGVVKWTLDQNGFKMTSVSDPILISEKYYHFRTDPRNINNFNLYAYSPADYKVSGTIIYDSNGKQASDGYYISFTNQMNLTDRSKTHTFITYKSEAIIPIIKTDIIISSTGAIQNSIFIQ